MLAMECMRGFYNSASNDTISVVGLLSLKLDRATYGGTWWRDRLRHYATSRRVAGLIPDAITGIFHWLNPSGRIIPGVYFVSNINEYKEYILGGTGDRSKGLTTLLRLCAKCGSLNLLEPSGPVQGLLYLYLFSAAYNSDLTGEIHVEF
jgi:hypothetical protein